METIRSGQIGKRVPSVSKAKAMAAFNSFKHPGFVITGVTDLGFLKFRPPTLLEKITYYLRNRYPRLMNRL